jgi:hypothetical protein
MKRLNKHYFLKTDCFLKTEQASYWQDYMGKWSCYGQIHQNSELLTTAEVLVEAGANEAGLDTYNNFN